MAQTQAPTFEDLFCRDLPTRPLPDAGIILVTGASGYIGGRLVNELLARGYRVRIVVRGDAAHYQERWPQAKVVVADALKPDTLPGVLGGTDAAFYLIHSLLLGQRQFDEADIRAARHFRQAAEAAGVRRILYLGGLGDAAAALSDHLLSRIHVAEELKKGSVPVTILRAATIMGSGSAPYEIIKHLVKKLPVIAMPKWAGTRCQPIGIRDAIKYLVGCLETPATAGRSFDIGGTDILTYRQMLEVFAAVIGKKRLFCTCPFSHLGVYAYLASLVTPVPAPIIISLMEGLRNEVVCGHDDIRRLIPFEPLSYREAVTNALRSEEQDKVYTRWSDASPKGHRLAIRLSDLGRLPYYTASYSLLSDRPAEALYASICRIGGREGWFQNHWMWRLRGLIDRLLMGVGLSRGRRSDSDLKINDVIDFWRVEDIRANRRLLLRAEMKLPGRGWLEFMILPEQGLNRLSIRAYYDTDTWFGMLYWYLFLPFHSLIFNGLIKQIDRRAGRLNAGRADHPPQP
jgi:uncharacterized protein YbjT (DUF2867 family)